MDSCVLGMVFLGPHIDAALASQLFRSLNYYQGLLPCLWSLYIKKRLLGFRMSASFSPEVEALLNATALAQLTRQVQQLESRRAWCTIV